MRKAAGHKAEAGLARKSLVLGKYALHVLADEDADQSAAVLVAAVPGDQKAADLPQTLDDLVDEVVGTGRRRAELHAVFCEQLGFSLPGLALEPPEHDSALVDDDAYLVAARSYAVPDLAEPLTGSARRNVFAADLDRAPAHGCAAFERQAVHGPVCLAPHVIVHAGEA